MKNHNSISVEERQALGMFTCPKPDGRKEYRRPQLPPYMHVSVTATWHLVVISVCFNYTCSTDFPLYNELLLDVHALLPLESAPAGGRASGKTQVR